MKSSANQGGCYPPNTLRDLQILHILATKAEFNNCFIIHSKHFPVFKGVSPLFCFSAHKKITQAGPQVFSVNGSRICIGLHFWRHFDVIGSIICSGLHFWRHWFKMAKILSKFGEQQLVMGNYACGFNQNKNTWIFFLEPWLSMWSIHI